MSIPVCFITYEGTGTLCSSEEIDFVFSLLLAQFPSSHIHQHHQANYAKKIFPLIFGTLPLYDDVGLDLLSLTPSWMSYTSYCCSSLDSIAKFSTDGSKVNCNPFSSFSSFLYHLKWKKVFVWRNRIHLSPLV